MNFLVSSVLLWKTIAKLPSLLMNTNKRLNTGSIKKDYIILRINSLNPIKAYGFNGLDLSWHDPIIRGFYRIPSCPNF